MAKNNKLADVVFKGERRAVYRNRNDLEIREGDYVIVEADRGEDLGRVSFVGELVRLKRGKGETKSIVRIATADDLDVCRKNKEKEREAFLLCKEKIVKFTLDMKLVDVELQFDGSKITFYFTAAQRVDFRELVKNLASIYRTRIELRQIGVRDEAKRIGGMGICGRKQCCSAFLSEFEQITTQLAKDQMLSLNPSKISGNCGRLLCCLNYEEGLYQEAFKSFPPLDCEITLDEKKGTLCFINIYENQAQVRFDDGTYQWFAPDDLKRAKVSIRTEKKQNEQEQQQQHGQEQEKQQQQKQQ
ncbi:MAG: stage 0 sporulation protein [Chitinivibrionales bacterium]|nr:stage 0 sporulation protein [Chitinivibrionales bacterium]